MAELNPTETAFVPVTAADVRRESEAWVVECCAKHVATRSVSGLRITYGEPGTSIYRQHFRIDSCWLLTYGDLGEAVYQWSSVLTWEFLAGCAFEYFESKCQASHVGRSPRGWNARVAETRLRECFAGTDEYGIRKSWADYEDQDLDRAHDTRDGWLRWLEDNGQEWFGDGWWEWAPEIGKVHDVQIVYQWKMLQLALASLGVRRG